MSVITSSPVGDSNRACSLGFGSPNSCLDATMSATDSTDDDVLLVSRPVVVCTASRVHWEQFIFFFGLQVPSLRLNVLKGVLTKMTWAALVSCNSGLIIKVYLGSTPHYKMS